MQFKSPNTNSYCKRPSSSRTPFNKKNLLNLKVDFNPLTNGTIKEGSYMQAVSCKSYDANKSNVSRKLFKKRTSENQEPEAYK